MATTVDNYLGVARGELGKYYRPGTNNKYGMWYAGQVKNPVYRNAQFCAMGLSWVAGKAGALDIVPLHAYTPSGVAWFKARGQWRDGIKGIKKGDLVYFDFPGLPNRISHVGVVESVNSDGSVNTIEFNTSGPTGDQRNGGAVMRKRRKAYIVGYGRPKWAVEAPAASPKKNKYGRAILSTKRGDLTAGVIKELQHQMGTGVDGVISSPSDMVREIQRFLRKKGYKGFNGKALVVDGHGIFTNKKNTTPRTNTIYALQSYLIDQGYLARSARDGRISARDSLTVRGLRKSLNAGGKWNKK